MKLYLLGTKSCGGMDRMAGWGGELYLLGTKSCGGMDRMAGWGGETLLALPNPST